MAGDTTLTLIARLVADVTGFVSGMTAAQGALERTAVSARLAGKEAAAAGMKMTTHLSLPLVALGGSPSPPGTLGASSSPGVAEPCASCASMFPCSSS